LGVDGISFPIVILTTFLFLTALIYSAKIEKRANTYVMLFLMLEMACLGVFMSLDLFLFYVFFEITRMGRWYMIAEWDHENSKQSALTFFLYELLCSQFVLLAFLSLYIFSGTFDMRAHIAKRTLNGLAAELTIWGLFIAFAIKTP